MGAGEEKKREILGSQPFGPHLFWVWVPPTRTARAPPGPPGPLTPPPPTLKTKSSGPTLVLARPGLASLAKLRSAEVGIARTKLPQRSPNAHLGWATASNCWSQFHDKTARGGIGKKRPFGPRTRRAPTPGPPEDCVCPTCHATTKTQSWPKKGGPTTMKFPTGQSCFGNFCSALFVLCLCALLVCFACVLFCVRLCLCLCGCACVGVLVGVLVCVLVCVDPKCALS